MSSWIRKDNRDHLRHIPSIDRRGSPRAEWKPDREVLGDRFRSPVGEEGVLEEDRRSDVYDGQSGPVSTCSPSQCCRCWGESVISVRLICDTVSWEILTNSSRSLCSRSSASAVTVASR